MCAHSNGFECYTNICLVTIPFGWMAFCAHFIYENGIRFGTTEKKEHGITFISGRLYCFVNYWFCCRRCPMRLLHNWWRFFSSSPDALLLLRLICHITAIFLLLRRSLSRSTRLPFFICVGQAETLNTTQYNTILWFVTALFSDKMYFAEI